MYKDYYFLLKRCVFFLFIFASCKNQKQLPKDSIYNISELKDISTKILNDSTNSQLYFDRAKIIEEHGDDSMASLDYIRAYLLDTNNVEYTTALGMLFFKNTNIPEAIKWFNKTIAKDPNNKNVLLKTAKLSLILKNYENAFSLVNKVLRQDAYNAEAYFIKGEIYDDMGNENKALSSFQTAIDVNPKYSNAYLKIGFMKQEKNDSTCLQYFRNAYTLDSNITGLYAEALYYQNHNNFAKAKELYKECIRFDEKFSHSYYNLGYIFLQEDSFEKSILYYDTCIIVRPEYAEAYINRGIAKEKLHFYKPAYLDFTKALSLDSNLKMAKEGLKRTLKNK